MRLSCKAHTLAQPRARSPTRQDASRSARVRCRPRSTSVATPNSRNAVEARWPVPPPILAGNSAASTPLRLQLDPNRPAEPYLDGAWWPRCTDLDMELPTLLAALSKDLGRIALVGYHRDAWNAAPGQLDQAGHPVHLEGFVSPNPPTVVVIADTGRRITLRVVPPDTDGATAAQAMTTATPHAVEPPNGGQVTNSDAVERRSLDEVSARLARLPGNTDPEHVALIAGWVNEAAHQFFNAPVQAFVPILVEHIVRGRLDNISRP
jgi:hypothetical protein